MFKGGQTFYLVRLKLLPDQEDLLQLVPPLLCPATHSSPTFTQGLHQKEHENYKKHLQDQNVRLISKYTWVLHVT